MSDVASMSMLGATLGTITNVAGALLGVAACVFAWLAYSHREYLRTLYQVMRHNITREQTELLGRVRRRKLPLEVFLSQRGRLKFVCSAVLVDTEDNGLDLKIVYYQGGISPKKKQLLVIFMPPLPFGDGQVNCIKGFVTGSEPRMLKLSKRVLVEFMPRRTSKRFRVADQRMVQLRMWFAAPADGPNLFGILPTNFEINVGSDWQENEEPPKDQTKPLISNISTDGVGVRLPPEQVPPDFMANEKVTMDVAIWHRQRREYIRFWAGGVIRNMDIDRDDNTLVGIQFTHQCSDFVEPSAHCALDSGYALPEGRLCWERLPEQGGIIDLRDIISRF